VPSLIEYVALTQETDGLRRVREVIQQAGAIKHTALARAMARFGLTRDKLALFTETLMEGHTIERVNGARGQYTYIWKGRRQMPSGEATS
jgi:hypothetical protein